MVHKRHPFVHSAGGGHPTPPLDNRGFFIYNVHNDTARRENMTAIVCDICKKAVPSARRDINYTVILDRDLCIPCTDSLMDTTKKQMQTRQQYLFKDYYDTLTRNLVQMCGR